MALAPPAPQVQSPSPQPAHNDPYPHIKGEIERELEHVERLQAAVFSGRPDAVNALIEALQGVDEQLGALERAVDAMVAAPAKFGLSTATAYHRQVEVEGLRFQTSDLKRSCDQVKATAGPGTYRDIELGYVNGTGKGSPKGRKGQAHRPPTSPLGHSANAMADGEDDVFGGQGSHMAHMVQEQDQALDEISVHVERIRHTGQLMHDEFAEQELLLGDLSENVDTQSQKLRGLKKRVQDILKRSGTNRQLCTIVVLSVILIIVTALALG